MTEQHPITPPQDLITKWIEDEETPLWKQFQEAARWGADKELEACIDFVRCGPWCSEKLRAARRPKPPSLKEQALALVEQHEDGWRPSPKDWDTIRRALEQLDD